MRSCSRSLAGVCITARTGLGALTGAATDAVCIRFIAEQADSARPRPTSAAAAQSRRPPPARCGLASSLTPITRFTHLPLLFIVAQDFELSGTLYINPRAGTCLDPAANPNPAVLKGLRRDTGRFDGRHNAP